jgi:RsmE family RNA methyltransferase
MPLDKHIFAVYIQQLPKFSINHIVSIKNIGLWERITRVLRLKSGDEVVLFDGTSVVHVILKQETFSQKNIFVGLIAKEKKTIPITPEITLLICLTRKHAFEKIVYTAAALGATQIIPVISQKSPKLWLKEKDYIRLQNILMAGCEQAKNFVLPRLLPARKFENLFFVKEYEQKLISKICIKIFFDPEGKKLSNTIQTLQNGGEKFNILAFFGPEGGFCLNVKISFVVLLLPQFYEQKMQSQ